MAAAGGIAVLVVMIVYAPETFRWMTLRQADHTFLTGLGQVMRKSQDGHASYLLGEISHTGWWYYFPVVVAVKTPVGLLLLLVADATGL
jgi:hypothetical protein